MDRVIVIYGVPGDPNNEVAQKAIRTLGGVGVEQVMCPASVRDLYRVPFIRDDRGERHFGIEGIRTFVDGRGAAQLAQ